MTLIASGHLQWKPGSLLVHHPFTSLASHLLSPSPHHLMFRLLSHLAISLLQSPSSSYPHPIECCVPSSSPSSLPPSPLVPPSLIHPLCSLLSPSSPSFSLHYVSLLMRHGGSSHHCSTRSRRSSLHSIPVIAGISRDIQDHFIVLNQLIAVTLFPSRGPKGSDELTSKYGFHYTGTYKWVDH